MNTIGELIRNKRIELKMSQTALAKEVGITQPFMAEIESGRKKPSLEVTMKLCKELGIQFLESDILSEDREFRKKILTDEEVMDSPPPERQLSEIEYALFGETKHLDEEQQLELLQIAKIFRERKKNK